MHRDRVALFKHILDFKRDALAKLRDKRKAKRYPVGSGFPVKATIRLPDSDQGGRRDSAPMTPDSGRSWGGALINLSDVGLSLQLPPAAVAVRGDQTFVTLSLEGHELRLPATIAHFRAQSASASCGVSLLVDDLAQRQAYLQLHEAVALGATLVAVEKPAGASRRKDLKAEQYRSDRDALLTAWRDPATKQLAGFELVLRDHCLRGEANRPTLEIFSNRAAGENMAWSAPGFAFSTGVENGEVRQLYRWVTYNLPRSVPADLRELMRFFAVTRGEWKAPPKAGSK